MMPTIVRFESLWDRSLLLWLRPDRETSAMLIERISYPTVRAIASIGDDVFAGDTEVDFEDALLSLSLCLVGWGHPELAVAIGKTASDSARVCARAALADFDVRSET